MFKIHETIVGGSMKGPKEIKQSSNLMNIILIRDNLTIK
jgi:hypothetical protein